MIINKLPSDKRFKDGHRTNQQESGRDDTAGAFFTQSVQNSKQKTDRNGRNNMRGDNQTNGQKTCNYCQLPGHFWRACWKREEDNKRNRENESMKGNISKQGDSDSEPEQSNEYGF